MSNEPTTPTHHPEKAVTVLVHSSHLTHSLYMRHREAILGNLFQTVRRTLISHQALRDIRPSALSDEPFDKNAYWINLKNLEYSQETYDFFESAAITAARKVFADNMDLLHADFSGKPYGYAANLYDSVRKHFFNEFKKVSQDFVTPTLSTQMLPPQNDNKRGWTHHAHNSFYDVPDLVTSHTTLPSQPSISLSATFEANARGSSKVLNTIVHELSHQAMSQLSVLLKQKKLALGQGISPHIGIDAGSNYDLIYGNLYVSPDTSYRLYRAFPDEILAFRTSAIFENYLEILKICHKNGIGPHETWLPDLMYGIVDDYIKKISRYDFDADTYQRSKKLLLEDWDRSGDSLSQKVMDEAKFRCIPLQKYG